MVIARAALIEGLSGTRHTARACKGDSKRISWVPSFHRATLGGQRYTLSETGQSHHNLRGENAAAPFGLVRCLSTAGMSSSR